MHDIGTVNYYKCIHCGFVLSKTHRELSANKWKNLNLQFHHYHEDSDHEAGIKQPPYAEQALMLSLLGKNGILDTSSMLDYAGGYGTLSGILEKYFDLKLPIYDAYVQNSDNPGRYIHETQLKSYKTVICSAMFEHVLARADLNRVNDTVDPDGSLIIHTFISATVPNDPDWFYLRPPVHTAFHTNDSMEILMNQWGYGSSIYSPISKCWVLLKEDHEQISRTVEEINRELQCNWFYYKKGFVDYWR